jgi:type VI secretion system secreted protein VgrG
MSSPFDGDKPGGSAVSPPSAPPGSAQPAPPPLLNQAQAPEAPPTPPPKPTSAPAQGPSTAGKVASTVANAAKKGAVVAQGATTAAAQAADKASDTATSVANAPDNAARSVDRAAENADRKIDSVANSADRATRRAESVAERRTDKAADNVDRGTDGAERATDKAADKSERATETAAGAPDTLASRANQKSTGLVEHSADKATNTLEHATDKTAAGVSNTAGRASQTAVNTTERAAQTVSNTGSKAANAAERGTQAADKIGQQSAALSSKVSDPAAVGSAAMPTNVGTKAAQTAGAATNASSKILAAIPMGASSPNPLGPAAGALGTLSSPLAAAAGAMMDPAAALAKAAWDLLTGETGLQGVEYTFHTEGDPGAKYRVRSVSGSELLSDAYRYQVEIGTTHGEDPKKLLGESCTVTMRRKDFKKSVQGIVTRIEFGEAAREFAITKLTLEPALSALSHRTNSRIFQDKTIPDVLEQVLKSGLEPYHRKARLDLRRTEYPKREYIVQHRESDLSFVRRLMADEGIWFAFEHPVGDGSEHAEVLVLYDENDAAAEANLGDSKDELPLHLSRGGSMDHEAVLHFTRGKDHDITSLTVRAYDWTTPTVPQKRSLPSEELGDRPAYEPDDLTLWQYESPKFGKFDTEDQARIRLEQRRADAEHAHGESNVVGLVPGQKVKVKRHPAGFDGTYLVTRVDMHGSYLQEGNDKSGTDYGNTFECLPIDLPFRPTRMPRPRVLGVQTATVVGPDGKPEVPPSGDDIHTDEHGRIQVKMSWDRSSPDSTDPKDPNTVTCFLRVAQGWGGSGWGFMFIPRIGMEVIVNFIDGDPDRPLVTGCVYNGLNRPHYTLPDEKTKSYIMTQSSPNGDGFNELCFEDAKGNEKIYVHAQKDYEEMVEHDHSTTVKRHQTNTVKGNQTESVGGNQSLTVIGKRTKTVGGQKENGESNTIKGERDTTVTKKNTETYQDEFEITVTKAVTETLNDTRTTTVKKDDYYCVSEGNKTTEVTAGTYMALSKGMLSLWQNQKNGISFEGNAHMQTEGAIEITNEKTGITGNTSGELVLVADSALRLSCGQAKLELKSDGTITLTGTKIVVGAPNNSITLEAAGVTTSGVKVSTTAIGIHEIQGAMIKVG